VKEEGACAPMPLYGTLNKWPRWPYYFKPQPLKQLTTLLRVFSKPTAIDDV